MLYVGLPTRLRPNCIIITETVMYDEAMQFFVYFVLLAHIEGNQRTHFSIPLETFTVLLTHFCLSTILKPHISTAPFFIDQCKITVILVVLQYRTHILCLYWKIQFTWRESNPHYFMSYDLLKIIKDFSEVFRTCRNKCTMMYLNSQ